MEKLAFTNNQVLTPSYDRCRPHLIGATPYLSGVRRPATLLDGGLDQPDEGACLLRTDEIPLPPVERVRGVGCRGGVFKTPAVAEHCREIHQCVSVQVEEVGLLRERDGLAREPLRRV